MTFPLKRENSKEKSWEMKHGCITVKVSTKDSESKIFVKSSKLKEKERRYKFMRKAKNLKKCMALVLAMMLLVGSNPIAALAETSMDISWSEFDWYNPEDFIAVIGWDVHAGGIATHSEKFLNSVYNFAGVISTSETILIQDSNIENHYSWGTLSGVLSVSASTFLGVSGSIGVSGEDKEGSASTSVESKSTSLTFSCAKNSEKTIAANLSAIGFLSCELMMSHYTKCYDVNTNRMVTSYSASETWDLKDKLD